jgi:hypothetical protein
MLNESLLLFSWDKIKSLLIHDLTILHVALVYVLVYVVYKALGRYIYFKPQEHASKINRTFLTLSLFVVLIHAITLSGFADSLPFLPEYRWLYTLCFLVLLIAVLSILTTRVIWEVGPFGTKARRSWHSDHLPIRTDYYKAPVPKTDKIGVALSHHEIEGVESTSENIHSDFLLNTLALIVFIVASGCWTYESAVNYGWLSYLFSAFVTLTIAGIYLDQALFRWISYFDRKVRILLGQTVKN